MSSLPIEVLEDIFSRLPVKPLHRLKCVSKSFIALISSPNFVKLHLNRSIQTRTNLSLFVRNEDYYWVDFYSLRDVLEPIEINYYPRPIEIDYYLADGIFCGSCDGLICMSYTIDTAFIWNPSTRKSIRLPHEPIEVPALTQSIDRGYSYEIGYDNTNDDYKVARMVVSRDDEENIKDYEIKVYSLRSNSWHKLKKFQHCPNFERRECIAGGALHWMSGDVKAEDKSLIASLDLGTEKYRVIPNPEYSGSRYIINLDNFEGCLSLSCHYDSEAVEVWLLKEYGGKNEHWSKLISLPPKEPDTEIDLRSVKPISYSKCGKKILLEMDFETLVWYNLEEESIEPITVHLEPFFEVQPCLESLVSLDVPAEVVTNGEKKRKRICKEEGRQ